MLENLNSNLVPVGWQMNAEDKSLFSVLSSGDIWNKNELANVKRQMWNNAIKTGSLTSGTVATSIIHAVHVAAQRTLGTYQFGGSAFHRVYKKYHLERSGNRTILGISGNSLYEWPSKVTENEMVRHLGDELEGKNQNEMGLYKKSRFAGVAPTGYNTFRDVVTGNYFERGDWRRFADMLIVRREDMLDGKIVDKSNITTGVSVKMSNKYSDHHKVGKSLLRGQGDTIEAVFTADLYAKLNGDQLLQWMSDEANKGIVSAIKGVSKNGIEVTAKSIMESSTGANTLYGTFELTRVQLGYYRNEQILRVIKAVSDAGGYTAGVKKDVAPWLNIEYNMALKTEEELAWAMPKPMTAKQRVVREVRYVRMKNENTPFNLNPKKLS